MLSIFPYQRCTNSAVNNRMKPPRQIRSILCLSSAACSTVSNAARSPPKGLLSMVSVAIPLVFALSRPPASDRLEITTAISAGKSVVLAASISAAMFDPRPETRIATRRFMASPCEIEMTVIDHAVFARSRDHLAQKCDALAALGQYLRDLSDRAGLDDSDHADAAVEGA